MANYKEHASTGGLVGLIAGTLLNVVKQAERKSLNPEYTFDWGEFAVSGIGGAAVGATAGVLPDLLEPATHPNHRKFFHSLTCATAIGTGVYVANQSDMPGVHKSAINVACVGYFSHLVLDGDTPKGLPVI